MRVRAGTSGYSYKQWKGVFYPEDLPASGMLRYYAERHDTVEINNTFYRMPSESVLRGWSDQVPEDFSFALKASRRITHQKRLADVADEVAYLLDKAAVLGPRLGPVLFQLPPWVKKDVARLAAFLELVPEGTRVAVEFRSSTWDDDDVRSVLRERGAAAVVSDTGEGEGGEIAATAGFGYLRMRADDYDDDALKRWADRLAAQAWSEAWVFFKHEDRGVGPRLAERFRRLAGGRSG